MAKVEAAYGDLKKFSRRLGVPYTTVREWRDGVPHWRVQQILAAAQEDGKDVLAKTKKRKAA